MPDVLLESLGRYPKTSPKAPEGNPPNSMSVVLREHTQILERGSTHQAHPSRWGNAATLNPSIPTPSPPFKRAQLHETLLVCSRT